MSRTLLNLGLSLKRVGRYDEAEGSLRRSAAVADDQAARTPRDHDARHTLAVVREELANLLSFRGRFEEADPLLRKADAQVEALATDFPSVVEYQNARASIRRDLANLLQDRGLQRDAEPAYVRAIEVGRALADAHPEVPLYRRSLAIHHHNLAGLRRALGRPAEAEAEFSRAVALIERLNADFPAVLDYQTLLGQILQSYAIFLRATGRFVESEPVFRRAIGHLETLAAAHPDVPEIHSLLAGAGAQAGDLLQILHRPEEAERALRRSAEVGERLTAEHPDVPAFANAAAISLIGLAQLALDRGETAIALGLEERLIRHARAAAGADPRNSGNRGNLLRGLGLLAQLRWRAGDDRAAEESVREMEAAAVTPIDFYNVACFMSLGLKAIARAPWPEAKRVAVARSCSDRAVAALRRALDRGYRNPGLIRTDPHLDPLRDRDDFRLLIMDLSMPVDPFAN